MTRPLRVAAVQVGRIDRDTPRVEVLARLTALLEEAASKGVQLAVFPEVTFTTFFPRYVFTPSEATELNAFYEVEDPETGIVGSTNVKAFFERANELGVDVVVGYAEKSPEGTPYNTASYVSKGKVLSKYRKVHLPGTSEPVSDPNATNQLEKLYFRPGNLGFQAFRAPHLKHETRSPIVGMMICNDRRWAEGWRCYGMQGTEIMCIGFNTTAYAPLLWGSADMTQDQARAEATFHHKLVVQSNSYSNSTFCITSARCGWDDGKFELITGSMIVDPNGHIVAENKTDGDEVVVADIDLDACVQGKTKMFCFEKHRRPEHYGLISERAGVVEPEEVA